MQSDARRDGEVAKLRSLLRRRSLPLLPQHVLLPLGPQYPPCLRHPSRSPRMLDVEKTSGSLAKVHPGVIAAASKLSFGILFSSPRMSYIDTM